MIDPLDTAPLRLAVQAIPPSLRTPLTREIVNTVRPGEESDAAIRRLVTELDRRCLKAARRHTTDYGAEALLDVIEAHPDLIRQIAAWAASWKAAA